MFENEQEFQKLVSGLRIDAEPNPAHRERLRQQMLQAFEQAAQKSGVTGKPAEAIHSPSSVLRLPFFKLAVAAVVLVAAGVVIWTQFGYGPMTFARVRAASEKMPWLYAVVHR
jgi:cytochrome c-type biogenesis protein CcmH/NrfG